MTPPGPHAMTAQAGAVGGSPYVCDECGKVECCPEFHAPTPSAAVPVEALEGLALAWEAEAHSDRLNSGHCAYALRQLIKERSNG